MPRLPTSLIRAARLIDPLLPLLLRPCRDLRSAQNELRWLCEHIQNHAGARNITERTALLKKLVQERSTGKPLQYILGTEFFGDFEIECRPGVLIPRQETAASITQLVHLLRKSKSLPPELRILDLCTGTGCIPLLFQDELSKHQDIRLELLGVDISKKAIQLARSNLAKLRSQGKPTAGNKISFMRADVLDDAREGYDHEIPKLMSALESQHKSSTWDILISNPPYVSPSEYWKTTTRSVRCFEPQLALVPPPSHGLKDLDQGDRFYPRLLHIARDVAAKIVLFEVADLDQALRVTGMARQAGIFSGIEIWRDDPGGSAELESTYASGDFPIVGSGNGRSVLCWRGEGAVWLGKHV
ncbi:S-adenosyl-L-methionine-dependent methyltransferase [Westerdykella ornata]|uniref:S-adenosyl-L-methionine-dependent methyltransferase n=1 Tax=Westerdykella ornata TaxID=318751 RepID=A0A6A6JDA9_WESOR|nr:S-adenosyl-L-methionine-dependent methyltransferase [Westerdykella ornata]KAF2274257.1 S-adenosyl-L-methionine-dependent methyltransferase [Westerdykella ornata]